jgi:hypothetical protein
MKSSVRTSNPNFGSKTSRTSIIALGTLAAALVSSQGFAQETARITCPKTLTVQLKLEAASSDYVIERYTKFINGRRDIAEAARTGQDFTYNLALSGAPRSICIDSSVGPLCDNYCDYVDDLNSGAGEAKRHSLATRPGLNGETTYHLFSTIQVGGSEFFVGAKLAPFSEASVEPLPGAGAIELSLTELLSAARPNNSSTPTAPCRVEPIPFTNEMNDTCAGDSASGIPGGDPLQPVYPDTTITRTVGWVTKVSFRTPAKGN